MSIQMRDPFYWNGEEYDLLMAEDIHSLFHPATYGIELSYDFSGCWKGFVIQLSVRENRLVWDSLELVAGEKAAPPIFGIVPVCPDKLFYKYKDIDKVMDYTGTITIGRGLLPRFINRSFVGPHSYASVFQLVFEKGKLVRTKDISGTCVGF